MKEVSLSGSPRENVGRKDAADLRRSGRIPGVLYGGSQQVHFSVSEIDLTKVVHQPDTLKINLDLGGKIYPSVVQEMQFHPITDRVVHFDLIELIPGKEVTTLFPVKLNGVSEGVRSGGKLVQNFRKMRVLGTMETFPERIEIDITPLKIGDMVRVKDVTIPGCKLLDSENSVVVSVQMTRVVVAETAAATPAAAPAAAPAKEESK